MAEQPLDFDSEFHDLISGIENPATDSPLHLDGGRLSIGLVLAPLPSLNALYSLLSLGGHHYDVVSIKPWSAAWIPVEAAGGDEDEFASLLAEERDMPPQVDAVARAVSRLSKYGAVALMSWLSEGEGAEPGVSGQITARRYVAGAPEADIPAGVLVGALPQDAEDLLLGRTTPKDYPGSINADGTKQPRRPFGWFGK